MVVNFMSRLLNMSLVGIYIIVVVSVFRMILMRFGRKYSYMLWLVVFLNLCIPMTLQSNFSLIPQRLASFSVAEQMAEVSMIGEESVAKQSSVQSPEVGEIVQEEGDVAVTGAQTKGSIYILLVVWLTGALALMLYNVKNAVKICRQLGSGEVTEEDRKRGVKVYKDLNTPFLWGLFRPVICIPEGLEGLEKEYIIAHEEYHRLRKDYLVKIFATFVVAIHWFNPFVWAAYSMLCKDMEMSCDEAVLTQAKTNIRAEYAESLLRYAAKQNGYVMAPLTFAEPSVKSRVKNVLSFRKKGLVITIIAVVCVISISAALVLRPSWQVVSWTQFGGHGVTFNYPADWTVSEEKSDYYSDSRVDMTVVNVKSAEESMAGFSCSIITVENYDWTAEEEKKSTQVNLNISKEELVSNVKTANPSARDIQVEDTMIRDIPAKRISFLAEVVQSYPTEKVTCKMTQYALNSGDNSIIFNAFCPEKEKELIEIYEKMFASIQIK